MAILVRHDLEKYREKWWICWYQQPWVTNDQGEIKLIISQQEKSIHGPMIDFKINPNRNIGQRDYRYKPGVPYAIVRLRYEENSIGFWWDLYTWYQREGNENWTQHYNWYIEVSSKGGINELHPLQHNWIKFLYW